jgi:hypothetical protein
MQQVSFLNALMSKESLENGEYFGTKHIYIKIT